MTTETQAPTVTLSPDQLATLFESIACAALTSVKLLLAHPGDGNVEHAVQVLSQSIGAAADKGLLLLGSTMVCGSFEEWLDVRAV